MPNTNIYKWHDPIAVDAWFIKVENMHYNIELYSEIRLLVNHTVQLSD